MPNKIKPRSSVRRVKTTTRKSPAAVTAAKRSTTTKLPRKAAANNARPTTAAGHEARLEQLGEVRATTEKAHKKAVDAIFKAALEALEDGVPMHKVHTSTGISRQWLYKGRDLRNKRET